MDDVHDEGAPKDILNKAACVLILVVMDDVHDELKMLIFSVGRCGLNPCCNG